MILNIVIALASGITNVSGRIINSSLADKIGILPGTFYNYLTGLITSAVFFMISSNTLSHPPGNFSGLPFYAYMGGAIGVFVVAISSFITPKISALYATVLLFIGQLFAGILVDYFTLQVFSFGKVAGGALVVLGLVYNVYIDKKQ